MLSLGPLSGMPLSSVPTFDNLRAIVVRCSPVAEYQPRRLVARLQAEFINASVRQSAFNAIPISRDSFFAHIVGDGPAAIPAPEQAASIVARNNPTAQLQTRYASVCERNGPIAQYQPRRIIASVYRIRHRVNLHKC